MKHYLIRIIFNDKPEWAYWKAESAKIAQEQAGSYFGKALKAFEPSPIFKLRKGVPIYGQSSE